MSNAFERLRQRVLAEVDKERAAATHQPVDPARRLGTFLQASLGNLGIPRHEFASRLDVERDYADVLLDGDLSASEIHDDLLQKIAQIVDYEPNLLRIMLGRSALAAGDASNTAPPSLSGTHR